MRGKELVRGLYISPGVAVGYVRIVDDVENMRKVELGDILVCHELKKVDYGVLVENLKRAAALVIDVGTKTSKGTIPSRELKKPCITATVSVGGREATKVLKEGNVVIVEGYSGEMDAVDRNGEPYKLQYGTVYQYLPDESGTPELLVAPIPPPQSSMPMRTSPQVKTFKKPGSMEELLKLVKEMTKEDS